MYVTIVNPNLAGRIAQQLLELKAIKLNTKKPFIWASGWKSPIYCDNRLTLSYPGTRNLIRNSLVDVVRKKFKDTEGIAGVATAGIPQGALIADQLGLPFIYIRSKPKDHGLTNLIEGRVIKGLKLVVVEDLVSTGGSSLQAVQAIKKAGMKVLGMVSIFTYGFQEAESNFARAKIKLYSLCDYSSLLETASREKYVSEKQLVELKSWRMDPENWKR